MTNGETFTVTFTKPGAMEASRYTATLKNREDGSEETVSAPTPQALKNQLIQKSDSRRPHNADAKQKREQKLNEMVQDLERGGGSQATTGEVATEGWRCYCWWIFCGCIWLPW